MEADVHKQSERRPAKKESRKKVRKKTDNILWFFSDLFLVAVNRCSAGPTALRKSETAQTKKGGCGGGSVCGVVWDGRKSGSGVVDGEVALFQLGNANRGDEGKRCN
jgi:hypothetical protein